jgi:hypothetical protein
MLTNEQLEGRLKAVEVFAMTALGLYLASARNHPEAKALFNALSNVVETETQTMTEGAAQSARHTVRELVENLSRNLPLLHGEQSH